MPVRNPFDALLSQDGGVIALRRYPDHRRALHRLVERGQLATVLPGVFAPPEAVDRLDVRLRALACWDDDLVLTRWAAARLTFWPDLPVPMITAALPRKRTAPPGFELVQETIPRPLIRSVDGIRVTAPELTALDLALTDHGAAIERVLRTRLLTVDSLDDALAQTARRRNNELRRRWLDRSRRRPWSTAERTLHELLRGARIDGWVGNATIRAGEVRYVVDLVFREARVVIEVDGYEFHRSEEQFHRDRRKWTDLAAAGWTVLHFTWPQLTEDPDWVLRSIRRILTRHRRSA
ncbi:DUF559 domain-containing protein [Microlunatus parietis]|uniref:Very-short-patch-repair endonuclease n=1 Tax=Microlunatus parietis TaxID=682979 RepID=A0A7Y9IBA9_9ACTN|nr:DUF559 domain-containing protein [Microlunatus parietis]NYE73144.1 very-short-patch-repair endonuclease [Microlunatus parietis]